MLQYKCFRREKTFSIVEFPISKSDTQSVVRPLETDLVPALACLEWTSRYCMQTKQTLTSVDYFASSSVSTKQNVFPLLIFVFFVMVDKEGKSSSVK